jgi:hypothetical protein
MSLSPILKPIINHPLPNWLLCLLPNILLLFAFSEKSYLAVFGLTLTYCFFVKKMSLFVTLMFGLILSLPFEHGLRSWDLTVVPPQPYYWNLGYAIYVGLSIKLIFSIMILTLIGFRAKTIILPKSVGYLFLAWIILTLISCFLSSRQDLAWAGFIKLSVAASCFLAIIYTLKYYPAFKSLVYILICSSVLVQLFVAAIQTHQQAAIGLPLMEDTINRYFLTSDGDQLYRSAGLLGHPTFLASFLSMTIPLLIVLVVLAKIKPWWLKLGMVIATLALSFYALYGTFSRSGWLITGSILIIMFLYLRWYRAFSPRHYLAFGLVSLFALNVFPNFIPRLTTIPNFFTTGSGAARLYWVDQSLILLSQSPWWGVGLNQFLIGMSRNQILPIPQSHLSPIHHTFLLFATETGIPATLCLILLIFLTLKNSWFLAHHQPLLLSLWLGSIAFIVSSQFHPLGPQDPTFEYFMLFLGILTAQYSIPKSLPHAQS